MDPEQGNDRKSSTQGPFQDGLCRSTNMYSDDIPYADQGPLDQPPSDIDRRRSWVRSGPQGLTAHGARRFKGNSELGDV